MIQDIMPHVFRNEYKPREARMDDYVLLFRYNEVYLIEEDGRWKLPEVEAACSVIEGLAQRMIYLFSVDDKAFYLGFGVEVSKAAEFVRQEIRVFRFFKPQWLGFAAVTGHHLYNWYLANQFCGRCAQKMQHSEKERAMICSCGNIVYPRISPVVIVGVTHGDKLLMTKYVGGGYRNYALIAGFVEIGETLEEAVAREVMEEAGVKVKNIRYYKSQPWGFTDSLLMGFYADLDGSPELVIDSEELAEGIWMKREDMIFDPDHPDSLDNSTISLTAELIRTFKDGRHAGV